MNWAAEHAAGLYVLTVLGIGIALVTMLALLLCRMVRRAAWQTTIWRAALLAMIGLLAMELSGVGSAVVSLVLPLPAESQPAEPVIESLASVEESVDTPPRSLDTSSSGRQPTLDASVVSQDARSLRDTSTALATPVGTVPAAAVEKSPVRGLGAWLAIAWLAGTLLLGMRMIVNHAVLCWFRYQQGPCDDPNLRDRTERIARRLGIRRRVRLLWSDRHTVPAATGVFRPTVILPKGFSEDFSRDGQDAMLAHELSHLASADPAWDLAAGLVCATVWWHPATWYLRRRMRATAESAADEASLLVHDGPGELAQCLVRLARRIVEPTATGWPAIHGVAFQSSLGRRVERLLGLTEESCAKPARAARMGVLSVLPICLLVLTILGTAWAHPQAQLNEGESRMNVLSNSWGRSLAAAVLVACWAPANETLADGPEKESPARPVVERERAPAPEEARAYTLPTYWGEDLIAHAKEKIAYFKKQLEGQKASSKKTRDKTRARFLKLIEAADSKEERAEITKGMNQADAKLRKALNESSEMLEGAIKSHERALAVMRREVTEQDRVVRRSELPQHLRDMTASGKDLSREECLALLVRQSSLYMDLQVAASEAEAKGFDNMVPLLKAQAELQLQQMKRIREEAVDLLEESPTAQVEGDPKKSRGDGHCGNCSVCTAMKEIDEQIKQLQPKD